MPRPSVRALLLSLIASVIATAMPEAHAKCAMWGLTAAVKTAPDATLPADGAIVVTAISVPDGDNDPGDVAEQKSWKLRIGKAEVAPAIELIAPGLALYRWPPQAKPLAAPLEIADKTGKVLHVAKLDPALKMRKLATPVARRVRWSQHRKGRSLQTMVAVELASAPPPGMIALVITDANGTAMSWGAIEPTNARSRTVHVFAPGRCQSVPNGTVEPALGDRVKLFWVDAAGRRSAASRTLVVAK